MALLTLAMSGEFFLVHPVAWRFLCFCNKEAARLAGVNIKRMRALLFTICGFASGITSVLLLSRVFAGQVFTGQDVEFIALTAALLDGFSFKGGSGIILTNGWRGA